jgi:hypothetical protein
LKKCYLLNIYIYNHIELLSDAILHYLGDDLSGKSDDFEIKVTYNDKVPSDISNNITIDKIFKIEVPVAIGGKTKTTSAYNYHVFTSSDNIIFTKNTAVDYLIVAGGGAGGVDHAGGGGAGGILSGSSSILKGTYPVTIGSGGVLEYRGLEIMNSSINSDGTFNSNETYKSNNGGNSSVFKFNSTGGGNGGGGRNGLAGDGGSGGGSGGYDTKLSTVGHYGKGIAGEGYNGGYSDPSSGGAGGGGSGQIGYNTNGHQGGFGGNGTKEFNNWLKDISSIMSTSWVNATKHSDKGTDSYYIGGGGGGGTWGSAGFYTEGGLGGGGNGGQHDDGYKLPTAGVENTGSGGGGGGSGGQLGAKGGSGLVVIRYAVINN